MTAPAQIWADPRLVYPVAMAAVALLIVTIWLFRRKRKSGRQAAVICLLVSVALHVALILLVPLLPKAGGGRNESREASDEVGVDAVAFSTFDPDMNFADIAGTSQEASIAPLPVSELAEMLDLTSQNDTAAPAEPAKELEQLAAEQVAEPERPQLTELEGLAPESLMATAAPEQTDAPDFSDALSEWLEQTPSTTTPEIAAGGMPNQPFEMASIARPTMEPANAIEFDPQRSAASEVPTLMETATANAQSAAIVGNRRADFANRVGTAKQRALLETGGDATTEQAVERALQFLVAGQRADGAWDPRASNAGVERSPLGMSRGNAGSRAETALTGLAVLSLLGAGHSHQQGDYADNVYRGLAYLIQNQKPDGSLAGNATVYESTYAHGMAALAMCEAAAITQDPSALESARRAIAYTTRMQHPTTGGWRYIAGDPGDLSQLGWQAMVIDGGYRAGIPIDRGTILGIERFLNSVRAGTHGGLARYRVGEASSRPMTAEALATRLLIGSRITTAEIEEAQQSILQQVPGTGQDNYYYWYYATLALHQLQDEAWTTWNEALKRRLLSTQRPDGSWPTDSVWGGYGGTIYTTSMATLCLETYYRHAVRNP